MKRQSASSGFGLKNVSLTRWRHLEASGPSGPVRPHRRHLRLSDRGDSLGDRAPQGRCPGLPVAGRLPVVFARFRVLTESGVSEGIPLTNETELLAWAVL